MNAPRYLILVAAGIACIVWGLPAAHRYRAPFDSIAALAVLAGLVMAITGALLVFIPGFFQG